MRDPERSPPTPRPGATPHVALDLATCALAGLAGVAVELGLVRLLGPWFGQSNLVWANAVGVVLGALALGSWVGGRLADRSPTSAALAFTLAPAAIWLAVSARIAPALGAWLAPSDLGGDRPLPLSFHGSLAATVILLAPPVFATGMVGPVCVRRLATRRAPGRAAGWVSATSTVGGLLACVLVPAVLVPAIGSRRVVLVAAALLGGLALAHALCRHVSPAVRPRVVGSTAARFGVSRPRAGLLLLAAFLVGLVVTGLEFAAVRRLAPEFGQSSRTYATVIGVVIAALALGYAAGGIAAGRRLGAASLAPALAGAGLLVLVVALGGPAAGGGDLLPRAALLFGPPTLLLGTASPLLVRGLAAPGAVGRAAGSVFAVGTVGSLLGCFAAPLWTLPSFGTRATLLGCAVGCVAAALAALATPRSRGSAGAERPAPDDGGPGEATPARRPPSLILAAAAAVVAPVALLAVPLGPLRADPGQVAERESAYQTVRVVEEVAQIPEPGPSPLESVYPEAFASVPVTFLRFDEDLASYQSLRRRPGEIGTGGRYYDHLALGAWFAGMPWTRAGDASEPRVLIVGYAGGTIHRVLRDTAPAGRVPRVVGVEIDPEVVALAREHLGLADLEDDHLDLRVGMDGRAVVASLPTEPAFDLVFVDAYQRTQYVPFHLATEEFFRLLARRLLPTGAIGVNVNAPSGLSGRLLRSLATTLLAALEAEGGGAVWVVPNPQYPGNATVWGTRGAPAGAPRLPLELPPALEVPGFALDRLLVRHVPETDGGERWTDDRAPVERWTDEALRPVDPR